MADPSGQSAPAFTVLLNHEAQYAIWPAAKPVPQNWQPAGMSGSREACLDFVRREWTDMRPMRLRAVHGADGRGA